MTRENFRYFAITDGASVCDIAEGEGGYNYFLYLRPGGSGLIMRENVAQTEYRFSLFGVFEESIWTARANRVYARTSEFKPL